MLDRPDALEQWHTIEARLRVQPPAVYLDYDGTLTPMAPRPEMALLAPSARELLQRLAQQAPLAIVTGRGLDDVRALVGMPDVCVAANHGFEIVGADFRYEADPELRPTFEALAEELIPKIGGFEGIVVESKGFSVAVHYRLTPEPQVAEVEAIIDAVVARYDKVRKAGGKKIFELRPVMEWHKGKAVDWLHAHKLGGGGRVALFIGDDRTDEDALVAVRDQGIGIYVGRECAWNTAAQYRLDDPPAVHRFLAKLIEATARPSSR